MDNKIQITSRLRSVKADATKINPDGFLVVESKLDVPKGLAGSGFISIRMFPDDQSKSETDKSEPDSNSIILEVVYEVSSYEWPKELKERKKMLARMGYSSALEIFLHIARMMGVNPHLLNDAELEYKE